MRCRRGSNANLEISPFDWSRLLHLLDPQIRSFALPIMGLDGRLDIGLPLLCFKEIAGLDGKLI